MRSRSRPGVDEIGGGPVGPFEDLEVIRVEAGMSAVRFCRLFGQARAHLVALAGQCTHWVMGEGAVAPAGPGGPPATGRHACTGRRAGSSQGVSHHPVTTVTSCPLLRCFDCCAMKRGSSRSPTRRKR